MPGDVAVEERDHRALAVVVERFVGDAVLVDAVPRLPHGAGAAVDHRQPRRLGVLQEQFVRDVEMPVIGEDGEQHAASRGSRCPRWVPASRMSSHEPCGAGLPAARRAPARRRGRGRGWPGCRGSASRRRRGTRARQASSARAASSSKRSGVVVVSQQPADLGGDRRRVVQVRRGDVALVGDVPGLAASAPARTTHPSATRRPRGTPRGGRRRSGSGAASGGAWSAPTWRRSRAT